MSNVRPYAVNPTVLVLMFTHRNINTYHSRCKVRFNAQQSTSHSSGYSWLTCPSDRKWESIPITILWVVSLYTDQRWGIYSSLYLRDKYSRSLRKVGIYRVSQEEGTKLRESVPYVKVYRYNPKHLYPK